MSTRSKRPRCAACRTALPDGTTLTTCGSCRMQGVLFSKKVAQRLVRRRSRGDAEGGR